MSVARIRTVLVPAAMELLGDLNLWLPGWLNRALPVVRVDAVEEPRAVAIGQRIGETD